MEFIKLVASIPVFALCVFLFLQAGQGFYLHSVFSDAVAMASRLALTHGRRGLIQETQETQISLVDDILSIQNLLFDANNQTGFRFNENFNSDGTTNLNDEQLAIFSGFVSNPIGRFNEGASVYNSLHQGRGLQITHILAIFLANRYIGSSIPYLQYPCLEEDEPNCFTCFVRVPPGCNINQGVPRDYFTLVCTPQNLGLFFQFIVETVQNRPDGYFATFVRPFGIP